MGVGSEKRPHSQSAQDPYDRGSTRVTRAPRGASRADPRGVAAGAVPPRCHPEAETMPGAQTAAAANSGSDLAAPLSDLPHPAGTPARPRTPAAWDPRPAPGPPSGNLVRLADLSPLGDPCRLSPPPGLGPLSGPEPRPAPGPLPPEEPPRPAGTPAAWDPVRPRDLRPAVGPSPSPGTHVRRGPPPGPAPPPAASPQAASRAALTPCRRCPGRARRSRAARRAGVAATMEPRGGAASQPSQPVSRSGSGSVSRSARSSCRREVATGLGQRASALAPPAPLRPAPGGARRSGPAPQPMERELSAEGGACRNKGRWGGAVPGLGCWVPRGPDPSERIRGPTRSDPGRSGRLLRESPGYTPSLPNLSVLGC
ncbi:proline-rich protein HaeIII subfamily 1 [Phocoena sinus]|uniref:proline-rich protein HaeIII subfamily 1 n=1 Tax=Phocoena sinus TaxID=42100 RepID=UPI0013C41CDC|nr:proline-rich protein HaeIII subfamily 1 [Phocoena sinus]